MSADRVTFLPPDRFVGYVVPGAIDDAWCAALIAALAARGFAATGDGYPAGYRDNDRLVFDDPALADALFTALGARLPAELIVDHQRWRLDGLNPRFRACRYAGGQGFCVHRDGAHAPRDDRRSHLTLQLYLDDDPARVGGRTRFYADRRGDQPWAAIAPARGAAIVFDHRAWHDGEAVTAGIKHVLRTDVMYRRVDATVGGGREATAAAGDPRAIVTRHRGYVWQAIVCADGAIASAGRDGTVRRAPLSTASAPSVIDLGAGSVTCLAEAADRRLWVGTRAGTIAVLDPAPRVVATDLGAALRIAAHGPLVACATARGAVVAFTAAGARAWTATAHRGWAWTVIAYEDSFASAGDDGRIARVDGHGRVRTLAALGAPVRALAATADGLVAGDTRGWLHHLAADGRVLGSWSAHAGAVTALAVAADGTWVSGSEDGTAARWRDRRAVATVTTADMVTSVAVDGDGAIVGAGYDGTVWRAPRLGGLGDCE